MGPDKSVTIHPQAGGEPPKLRDFLGLFEYTGRAFALVVQTSRSITLWLFALSAAAGLLPAAIAYVGKLIVDGVVQAAEQGVGVTSLPSDHADQAAHASLRADRGAHFARRPGPTTVGR